MLRAEVFVMKARRRVVGPALKGGAFFQEILSVRLILAARLAHLRFLNYSRGTGRVVRKGYLALEFA